MNSRRDHVMSVQSVNPALVMIEQKLSTFYFVYSFERHHQILVPFSLKSKLSQLLYSCGRAFSQNNLFLKLNFPQIQPPTGASTNQSQTLRGYHACEADFEFSCETIFQRVSQNRLITYYSHKHSHKRTQTA